jgi:hypothetical protein
VVQGEDARYERRSREEAGERVTVDTIGIDHVYIAVRDMERSEEFYDAVMEVLGFRKGDGTIGGDPTSSITTATSSTR